MRLNVLSLRFALLSMVSVAFVACAEDEEEVVDGSGDGGGDGSGDGGGDGSGEAPTTFKLRVTHMSADTPAVAIYNGDSTTAVVPSLAFGSGTQYLELPAGDEYTFNVRTADAEPTSDPALQVVATPEAGDVLNVAAIGFLSGDPEPLETLVIIEDLTAPAEGNIRLQVVHAAPQVGQVDVYNIVDGDDVQIVPDLDYGSATGAYLEVPAGAYNLGVDTNNDPLTLEVTFTTPNLAAGTIATIYATNNADGDVVLVGQFADGTTATIAADGAN
jgi:hypothetical protein